MLSRLPTKPQHLLLAALASFVASRAQAQSLPSPGVELHQFHGSPFSERALRLDGTGTLPAWKVNVGLDADYAFRPLIVADASTGAGSHAFVRQAVGLALRAAVGLGERFEVAALVPVTAFQTGDTLAGVDAPDTAGLEAVRLGAKVRGMGDGRSGAGLGAAALIVIPTGSAGGLIHEDGLGAEMRAFGDYRAGDLTLAMGAGVRLRRDTRLYDIALSNELLAAASAELRFNESASAFAELAAATALASPFASAKQTPVEVLAGGRLRAGALTFFGAAGPGLSEGYGTPVVRLVAGASWSSAQREVPRASAPRPPVAVAAAPVDLDADKDGIPVPADKCPTEPETKNGYKDDDGCPDQNPHDVDTDKDGLMDDVDKCVGDPEDKDGFEDEDGCPDPDNDKDGIPDVSDKCPTEPETINNVKDDDGCPDKGQVTLKEGELETLKPIFFATDRARVRHAFHPALDDIAAILEAHPEIGRCAVEGHTDATGPPEWNKKLSLERAKSVAIYLIAKGVEPGRVIAIGQGEALPWATNQTEAGRAANRRVIFHIEGVSDDQDKKQLELQRARGLKETGAEPAPAPPAAPADRK